MSIAQWPKLNENGCYTEGDDWTCGCCDMEQFITTEEMDPQECLHCGEPTCLGCMTEIGYCEICETDTREEEH